MATAAVRHRSTGVKMRGQTARQNKMAIRMEEADGVNTLINYTNPHIIAYATTLNGVRRVRALADEFGVSSLEINDVYSDGAVKIDVWFDD